MGNPIEDLVIDFSKTEKCLIKGWTRSFCSEYLVNLTEEVKNPNTENEYAKLIKNNLS